MSATEITLSSGERNTIDQFVNEMMDAGKTSKQDDFYQSFATGKGCEQALANFLNDRHSIEAEVDYDVYHGRDETDLIPYQTEIKSVVEHGSYLAIPSHEAESVDEDEPIVAVRWLSLDEYEILGWAYKRDLTYTERDEMPFPAKYDNLLSHEDTLRTDWRELCKAMGADPESYSKFTFCSNS